jgi:hypothetical protein
MVARKLATLTSVRSSALFGSALTQQFFKILIQFTYMPSIQGEYSCESFFVKALIACLKRSPVYKA